MKSGIVNTAASGVVPVIAGVVSGCGCEMPLLASILYFIGLGTFAVSNVMLFVSKYNSIILYFLVFINLAVIYYQLGKIPNVLVPSFKLDRVNK
ncbi:MAG: hypothetical protein ACP5RP_00195 [Candidatus Micrarchaeia archaeon]